MWQTWHHAALNSPCLVLRTQPALPAIAASCCALCCRWIWRQHSGEHIRQQHRLSEHMPGWQELLLICWALLVRSGRRRRTCSPDWQSWSSNRWVWCGLPRPSRSIKTHTSYIIIMMCLKHQFRMTRSMLEKVAFLQSGALCLGLDSTQTNQLLLLQHRCLVCVPVFVGFRLFSCSAGSASLYAALQYNLQTNETVCQPKGAAILAFMKVPVLFCLLLQAQAADALAAKQQAEASATAALQYCQRLQQHGTPLLQFLHQVEQCCLLLFLFAFCSTWSKSYERRVPRCRRAAANTATGMVMVRLALAPNCCTWYSGGG